MNQTLTSAIRLFLALTLALPSYGLAAPSGNGPDDAPSTSLPGNGADDYAVRFAKLETRGDGQPDGTLPPDRFLLMEQTVFHKEIPVVRTFAGHVFRRWRLKALNTKVRRYLAALPRANQAVMDAAGEIAFAKAMFVIYADLKGVREADLVSREVLQQVARLETPEQIAAVILKHLRIGDKAQLLAEIADPGERLQAVTDVLVETALAEHINIGRRVDTPLFLWESKLHPARLARIQKVLAETERRWNANDTRQALNPTEAPYERKSRFVNWWDTRLQIQDGDRVVRTLRLADGAAGGDTSQSAPFSCASGGCRFNIVHRNGSLLHVFGVTFKAIATFNQFVVFSHPDAYDAETGTQYLYFLDLGTYNGLLGNEDLPVFRLPLKIDQPVETLTARGGNLVVNESFFVQQGWLEQASELQQVGFNLEANLLSPDSWAKILPLVDSVQEFGQKVIHSELILPAQEQAGLREVGAELQRLGAEIQADLDKQKRQEPWSARESKELKDLVENAPAGAAIDSLRQYHAKVSRSEQLAKIMRQTSARARVSRKMGARVRLLASALVSPRPFASQKIKEALGSWYVRHDGADENTMMERVLRLTDRPYVNAGVIAAALTAAVAPESFNVMVNAGLSVGSSVVDYVVFCLKGLGEASVAGTKATFAPFTDLGGSLAKQYINDGAWVRTAIGIPSFIGVLAGLYFIPHFCFNFAQLRRDLKKPEVNGFIDRMHQFREAYYERLAADEGERRHTGGEFTPEEDAEIREFVADRKDEIAGNPGLLRRAGRAVRNAVGSVRNLFRPARTLIETAMESQSQDIEKAIAQAEVSPAVAKAIDDKPVDYWNFWKWMKSVPFAEAMGDGVKNLLANAGQYAKASREFMFSYPAIELTLERWAGIWNEYAMWRFATFGFGYVRILGSDVPLYIKVKPVSFATKLLYPEFMKTVALRRKNQRVLPSELNGGTRGRLDRIWTAMGTQPADRFMPEDLGIDPQNAIDLLGATGNWNPAKHLAALKKFEDQIIDVEQQVSEVAFRGALEALTRFMTDPKDLKILFNSKSLDNIVQKDVRELSWKSQTFLRAYYESVYNAGMLKFLNDEIGHREHAAGIQRQELNVAEPRIPEDAAGEVDVDQEVAQETLSDLKHRMARLNIPADGEIPDYSFDMAAAKAAALDVARDPAHEEAARQAVSAGRMSAKNLLMNTKYALIADYDPTQNPSMTRVEKVHRRLQSPGALARAVRTEITKLLSTMPLDLGFRLLLTAGIMEGALKPLQEHFWGPNSVFYLSETSFYMIMASGFFMSMMADAWLKLQQDARQDEMGEFGQIPKGEDAEKSFLRWYFKQLNEPENSVLKNWGFSNYIAFWNLPAALANISLFYFMFSGRVDLSLLMTGYIIAFGTPLSAIHYKVDQAFERAVHYHGRGVKDEKWMAHPDMQKMLVPQMQRSRFWFTFWNDILSTVQSDWLSNIEFVPTGLGTRGMQRSFFGGGLLEEYIVNGALQPLQKAVAGVPVLDQVITPVARACELLLTNGNTDLRLKK